jgi:surfeit locus 1 family protein
MRPTKLRESFRRPSATLALCTAAAFLALCALGVWQLDRRVQKAAQIELLTSRIGGAVIAAPAAGEAPPHDYQAAIATGHFDHAKEMRVYGRTHGGDVGVDIITPLRRSDGRGVLLVDRGFVPMAQLDPASRSEGQPDGEVTVAGVMRLPIAPGWFTPANDAARNNWFHLDPAEMGRAAGLAPGEVAPYVLVATRGVKGGPLAAPIEIELSDNHLQYALTWFGLAFALVVIFAVYHRKPPSRAGESG